MPSNWLFIDTKFPSFTGQETTDQKITVIQDYMFMLVEQLRYTLFNLKPSNFNGAALEAFTSDLTDPIYRRIEDGEGNITQLWVTAQGLQTQVSDNKGNISILQQTATSLQTQITNNHGDIYNLQITAKGLQSQVSDALGNISILQQTATSLQSQITSANGNISALQQTANSFSVRISNAERDISSIEQYVDSITLSVRNGESSSWIYLKAGSIDLGSAEITFTGLVTFYDLEYESGTRIYGGNIDTDTLYLDRLYGRTICLYESDGYVAAIISLTGASSYAGQKFKVSSGAIELSASPGDVYIQSGSNSLQLSSGGIRVDDTFYGTPAGRCDLGTSAYTWGDVYAENSEIITSDRQRKKDIAYGLAAYEALFDSLRPVSYRLVHGTSGRVHLGLIAQDVEESLAACGLTSMDFAGLIKTPRRDGAGEVVEGAFDYALRYGELTGLVVEQVQKLKAQVQRLKARVAALEEGAFGA